jgi:hypothetical protein
MRPIVKVELMDANVFPDPDMSIIYNLREAA